ncbi:MAG: LptE family protein [Pirellulales bacterium]|nr:LptE family protein [Pirellulales bacterium]
MLQTVSNRWFFWFVALPWILGPGGCATYRVGARSLYAPDVTTVYVPVFESDSFRPDLAERLTEAVVKEIELNTPYKVVSTSDADSVLSGRITSDTKRVVVEDFYDAPRELDMNLQVNVSWLNRRREPIREPQVFDWPGDALGIGQSARLIPEAGQSVAVSQQQAIQRLAKQIVAAMEEPW